MFKTRVLRAHLQMHGADNTCRDACILSTKNAQALVHARLCNGAEASLPWKLMRTYHGLREHRAGSRLPPALRLVLSRVCTTLTVGAAGRSVNSNPSLPWFETWRGD